MMVVELGMQGLCLLGEGLPGWRWRLGFCEAGSRWNRALPEEVVVVQPLRQGRGLVLFL